jgi:hypothetical protein
MKLVRAWRIKHPSGPAPFLADKPGDESPGSFQMSRWDRPLLRVNRP